jgi:hypothetical protein
LPTAKQLVELRHETAASVLLRAVEGFGLATTDHAVPFHRSIKLTVTPEPLT